MYVKKHSFITNILDKYYLCLKTFMNLGKAMNDLYLVSSHIWTFGKPAFFSCFPSAESCKLYFFLV